MEKLKTKKQINMLAFLFAVTYMVSYITRINYGAVISEMESATGLSRSLLSMAVTGSFITYGIGQTISGILGDRLSPKKLMSYGLSLSVVMNLLIPICASPYQMLAVWCVNGFAQAFMWPPLVRLMSAHLSDEDYKKTTVKVSWGSSIGTIVLYLVSPLLISAFSWRAVFIFSAICGTIMVILWNRFAFDVKVQPRIHNSEAKKSSLAPLFTPLMICVMIAIMLQGMLRDGITTWMPTFIADTYNLSNAVSILTGVLLPIFTIACFQVVSPLYRKVIKNPLLCSCVIFVAGIISASMLYLCIGKNAVVTVIFSALLAACMHGVNLILICMLPHYFERYGIVSTASGILNSCTYVGSALSAYGIAILSEIKGWNFTVFIWLCICIVGALICLFCAKPWNKAFPKE